MTREKLKRHTRIATTRIKKKKNPFVFRAKSKNPKYLWLKQRQQREQRFRLYGLAAIVLAIVFMISLVYGLVSSGAGAFLQTQIHITIPAMEKLPGDRNGLRKVVREALLAGFPEVTARRDKMTLYKLVGNGAIQTLQQALEDDPEQFQQETSFWVAATADIDMYVKGYIDKETEASLRPVSDQQIAWITRLQEQGQIRLAFNSGFFTQGDSRNPEDAGILTAIVGSFLTILVCLGVAFPFGVASAIYLEEFAPKNWFTTLIEININNLAAVPSIIFGLLGLSIFLNYFNLPRSSALVGGLTLALLILPVIVIATRNALQTIPTSIRYAAIGLGATKVQTVFHHIVPYAMPGIMTGVVLGVARALGETAPLLMIGMMAFIADVPHSITDPTTALPIQVYLWSDSPEMAFAERTSAAILVLLVGLVLVNIVAMLLRKRFEIKW